MAGKKRPPEGNPAGQLGDILRGRALNVLTQDTPYSTGVSMSQAHFTAPFSNHLTIAEGGYGAR
jgi:hypothetical protein